MSQYNYRIFFKKKKDASTCKSHKNIEFFARDFEQATKMAHNIAKKEKLRVAMVAELPR